MSSIQLKISVLWIVFGFIILPFIGFMFRSAQLKKKQKRILHLEEEMLRNHSEILSLQDQLHAFQAEKGVATPVVSLKEKNKQRTEQPESIANNS